MGAAGGAARGGAGRAPTAGPAPAAALSAATVHSGGKWRHAPVPLEVVLELLTGVDNSS